MVTFDAKDGSVIRTVVHVDWLGPPDIKELGKMKRIKILLLLICCSFAHSLYAQSNQQLDFIINAPIAKLKTLEEAEKIEAVLENRDTDRFIKFWEKNAKKFGEHIIVLESISNYGSYGGGHGYPGSDPSIAADYEVMESFLLSLPMN